MSADGPSLRQRVQALLDTEQDRGALLRELTELAADKEFEALADLWAPVLVEREPRFFETFLLRHLSGGQHAPLIGSLLPRIEASGSDALYNGLYRKVAREDLWDKEIRALVSKLQNDEELQRAIDRRKVNSEWFGLSEDTALALYKRNPRLFGPFVADNVHRGWTVRRTQFGKLREAMRRDGNDDVFWKVFRRTASTNEWKAELQDLLKRQVAPEDLSAELQKRHPESLWDLSGAAETVLAILEKHGRAALPYIEKNLLWLNRSAAARLLQAVEKVGDDDVYWRIFFKTGDAKRWNDALRALVQRGLPLPQLVIELERRAPSDNRWGQWTLDVETALAFYGRERILFRPFLERFATRATRGEIDTRLFREAESANDEEFLDYLTFDILRQMSNLVNSAHPSTSALRWGAKPDENAKQKVGELSAMLTGRFDRLYRQSPEAYVRHAAHVLGFLKETDTWIFLHDFNYNPALAYLVANHHEAWVRSPEAVRDLLESTNIHVQSIGLSMLSKGGPEAAQRVGENAWLFRALLLGRGRINSKKKALQCLEMAARQGAAHAERILPLLEDAMDFTGKRAVGERAMVSYVRVRHAMGRASLEAARA